MRRAIRRLARPGRGNMPLPEQSLRPRRGGLEHLAVPGNAATRQAGAPPVSEPTHVDGDVHLPVRDTVPTQITPADPVTPAQSVTPAVLDTPAAGAPAVAVDGSPQPPGPPRRRPRPRDARPDRRSWGLVIVMAAVVLLVGGLAAASLVRGGSSSGAATSPDGDGASGAADEPVAGDAAAGTIDDPAVLGADDLPESWAEPLPGTVVGEPVRWVDATGVNTLVLTTGTGAPGDTDDTGAAATAGSLYVTLMLGEGDAPVIQRQMREPATPSCPDGTAFRDDSVQVSDHDGDGVGEVTTGWSVGCVDAAGVSTVKLALLEGGDKYILRGTGSASGQPVDAGAVGSTAEPEATNWPSGALDATTALFGELFGG